MLYNCWITHPFALCPHECGALPFHNRGFRQMGAMYDVPGNGQGTVVQFPALYDDGLVRLDADGVTLRYYYFPLGTAKRIPYAQIRGVQERQMGTFSGRGRIWGSGDFVHWTPLDLRRPLKSRALILDRGTRVKPFITPDDPNGVLAILRRDTRGV